MYFFNNSKTYDHGKAYGIVDAFFDLATTGFQATQITNISRGDTCVDATKDEDGQIRFSW